LQRRIAEFLATIEDAAERRSLLAEALTPPPPTSESSPDAPSDTPLNDTAIKKFVESLACSPAASDEPASVLSNAHTAGQQPADRERPEAAGDGSAGQRENGCKGGDSADMAESEGQATEDLLHTSPLQLLQVCLRAGPFLPCSGSILNCASVSARKASVVNLSASALKYVVQTEECVGGMTTLSPDDRLCVQLSCHRDQATLWLTLTLHTHLPSHHLDWKCCSLLNAGLLAGQGTFSV
jgi:hypothetical protein